jgi:hypothetical protein
LEVGVKVEAIAASGAVAGRYMGSGRGACKILIDLPGAIKSNTELWSY